MKPTAAPVPVNDQALCGEDVLLRVTRNGFELTYLPAQEACWRIFPPDERAERLRGSSQAADFVAEVDGQAAGVASVCETPLGWADVTDLRVDVSLRRKGAGSALIGACQTFAERRRLAGLRVATTDRNPGLCQFLQHEGFQVQGFDRMAAAATPEERARPLRNRAVVLYFYRPLEKG